MALPTNEVHENPLGPGHIQPIDLARQHHGAGRLPEAERLYQEILQGEPDQPDVLHMLGLVSYQLGKSDIAIDLIKKAIALKPDYVEAYYNLGNVFKDWGRLEDAVGCYQKATTLKPDLAKAHYNHGNALRALGQIENAVVSYNKALAIKPDFAETHNNLGGALLELGRFDEAFKCCRRAISLNPQNDLFWIGLAASLENLSFTSVDDEIWQILLRLLERTAVRPSFLVQPVLTALRHHPHFLQIFEQTVFGNRKLDIDYGGMAAQLSEIPLFLQILGLSPINDLKVELMLTVLRHAMLAETIVGEAAEKGLPFSAALALQCFTNEYVYPETDEEKEWLERLQTQIATLLETKCDVPPSLVVALGSYRPLYRFPWAQKLGDLEWDSIVKEVIERQILEPLEEQTLGPKILRLTPVQDTVSQSVREQYEENPFPRWVKTDVSDTGKLMGAVLRGAPLSLDVGEYAFPEAPEILIAGCGTGRHSLETASRYLNARVLAVDLSLSSLCYASRKTKEFGLSNIEYAQADILELGSLGRRFDLIESIGVLHHLGDPLAGWQVLVDLLKPGGFMKIGLYSEVARQDIVRGRSFIAEMGYAASIDDVRQCRQDIIAMAEDGNQMMSKTCNAGDFYSLSNCRDLLFHVQEHRFTLPQIREALTALNLQFLGFEIREQATLRKFSASFSKKQALASLSQWHKFERKNPDTFRGMYQFWCKKI
jgi:tetratricopeptide (TPR) repeat protein/2-polyprenyl-3-methyl-5-hydroxy-6-metoxy-1,4-benzoquinol methylase